MTTAAQTLHTVVHKNIHNNQSRTYISCKQKQHLGFRSLQTVC